MSKSKTFSSCIDRRKLYGDEYKALSLCESPRETKLIRRFIDICANALEKHIVEDRWSFDGICYAFAETVVNYSKMAYDNLILGHFHAVNMINRTILENCVLLDVLIHNDDLELWKYYLAHSYQSTIYKSNRIPTQSELDFLKKMLQDHNISDEFYIKQNNRKKAYIDEPYGWTYQINKNFTFAGVCKLVNEVEYRGFQMMSEYTHATSLYTKLGSSVFIEQVMNMFVSLYIELYRMVTMYCWDTANDQFDEVSEKLEDIFYNFIDYEEAYVYKKK